MIIGIDLSAWAIDQAKMLYKQDNLQFMVTDVTDLKFKDCTFDIVTSFQVIEHLKNYKKHLSEVKRVLKPRGIFIITTPNKNITSPNREKPILPFHIQEFSPNEFCTLLSGYFGEVKVMGQKIINKLYLEEEARFRESNRMEPHGKARGTNSTPMRGEHPAPKTTIHPRVNPWSSSAWITFRL